MNISSYPVDGMDCDDFTEPTTKTWPFNIGQSYTGKTAVPIQCKECGGYTFHVAVGDYYTAIRCPLCQWQVCIHQG